MAIRSKRGLLKWFYQEHSASEVARLLELFRNQPTIEDLQQESSGMNYMEYLPKATLDKHLPNFNEIRAAYKEAIRQSKLNKSL